MSDFSVDEFKQAFPMISHHEFKRLSLIQGGVFLIMWTATSNV